MLSDEQVDFLSTFGYVVADAGALTDVIAGLTEESRRALACAYPLRPNGTIKLPAMSSETPKSQALLHDPRLLEPAGAFLGGDVIATPAKITRYALPTDWHKDCDMDLRGLKCVVYLEVIPGGAISFDLVPASHRAPVRDYVDHHFTERRNSTSAASAKRTLAQSVPVYTLQLLPGQPLFLDLGLWHANLASTVRLQWMATYLAAPTSEQAVEDTVSYLGWFFDYPHDYPRDLFPYLPSSWEAHESDSPLFGTMQACGVLERYLQRYGRGR